MSIPFNAERSKEAMAFAARAVVNGRNSLIFNIQNLSAAIYLHEQTPVENALKTVRNVIAFAFDEAQLMETGAELPADQLPLVPLSDAELITLGQAPAIGTKPVAPGIQPPSEPRRPRRGDDVYYVLPDAPIVGARRAATVVNEPRGLVVDLFPRKGDFDGPWVQSATYDETGRRPGSWHWPE